MAAKVRRQYVGAAAQTSITSSIVAGDTTVSIASTTGWPTTAGVPFYVVIDPDTAVEEKCSVTISGSTLTLTRGVDGTVAAAHSSGATIYPVFTAVDADEANELASKFTAKGDIVTQGASTFTTTAVGADGTFLKASSAAAGGVAWDTVDLGTDTSGNYVATIAGTANQVSVSGSGSESAAVTLSTPQDIHTGATPTFAGGVFSGSSAGDLLRITQTGSGNALVVEDSANPDSTPFVVAADGTVAIGTTTPLAQLHVLVGTATGVSPGTGGRLFIDGNNANNWIDIAGSTTGEVGLRLGDSGGMQRGRVAYSNANDALDFYTAGSERMRIDSAGRVGIGASPNAAVALDLRKTITGGTAAYGVFEAGVIQSDVTSTAHGYMSSLATQAASFTLTNLIHFRANQSTIGAGSTVTSQFGFWASSSLTGATTNVGFYGDIASGSGRWNLYMNGTAANYLAGRLGVGATLTSGAMAQVVNTTAADIALLVKGAASQTGNLLSIQNSASVEQITVGSDGKLRTNTTTDVSPLAGVTPEIQISGTGNDASIGANRFSADSSPPRILFVKSRNTTIGSHTVVANGDNIMQIQAVASDGTSYIEAARITAQVDGTPGTNDMPGRLIFSTTADGGTSLAERMRITSTGFVGIGTTTSTGRMLGIGGAKTGDGGTSGIGVLVAPIWQSDITTVAYAYHTVGQTQAASYTLSDFIYYSANQGTFGAGSTVTNQYGFHANSNMTGATNNYGFYGNIASGSGRWNLYMNGTAANYLAGRLGVGATLTSGAMAQVVNTTAADDVIIVKGAAGQSGQLFDAQNSAGTTLVSIDSNGNLAAGHTVGLAIQGGNTPKLAAYGAGSTVIGAARFSADGGAGIFAFAKSRNATIGSHTVVVDADSLGQVQFFGSDGTNYIQAAKIEVKVDGTPGTNDMPGRIVFETTADGASSPTERMRITNAGNIGFNMTTFSGAKVVAIADGTAPTANPTGGGYLYVESGALKYRGSSGTVTTIANA